MSAYQTKPESQPRRGTELLAHAERLVAAGQVGAARPLMAAARASAADDARVTELSARIAIAEGALEDARDILNHGIAAAPDDAGLRICRAELLRGLGDPAGAAQDAAEAVILDSTQPSAKALLGVLMLDLGRPQDAQACLREAVVQQPANPAFREALALSLAALDDRQGALGTLTEGIEAAPNSVALRNAAVLMSIRARDFPRAIAMAEAACSAGVVDACLFGLKGHALSSLGRHEEAALAYADALKLGPNDPYVRHLVAAAGLAPESERAPADYIRVVFDGYAERFEQHLISLGYRAPGLIRGIVAQHPHVATGGRIGPVLDLGCGTGLAGVVLNDLTTGSVVGVDLSRQMLAEAAQKRIYDELHESDIVTFLEKDTRSWQLAVAADVFCYFGALDGVFAAVRARLQPGGWLVCTTEDLESMAPADGAAGEWRLYRQGRYMHTAGYLRRAAERAGFIVRALERESLRLEADEPVGGILAVLERPAHDNA